MTAVAEWLASSTALPASGGACCWFETRQGHGGLVAGRVGSSPLCVSLTLATLLIRGKRLYVYTYIHTYIHTYPRLLSMLFLQDCKHFCLPLIVCLDFKKAMNLKY